MKVKIDRDRDGWHYFSAEDPSLKGPPQKSLNEARGSARNAGHEIDNAGWRRKLLSWNWHAHAIDGYTGWEREGGHPAFVKLEHVRGKDGSDVESSALANAWDDVAEVDFYQRDWTDDGIPFVRDGETYWSGWWFATIAERDRFLRWHAARTPATHPSPGRPGREE